MNIPAKISSPIEVLLNLVCQKENRGKSYVTRELMMRELALYENDGKLKTTRLEDQAIEEEAEDIVF